MACCGNVSAGYGITAFDFVGEQEGELSFQMGEIVRIDGDVDEDWQEGTLLSTSASGIFPAAFVSALEFGR